MAHTPPTPKPVPVPDPLINLGETSAEAANQRNKRGFLSSFLQGSRNRSSGFLSGIIERTGSLGTSNV
jgi:hypothetical protein